ncbi:hypothetical protein BKA66DRAFT_186281 [Pyrenochaeta sp. MPI-SDFR-AT-0127]|nr:hypothetical protein BKA66DRAFT_186281 [Pyrenochaeta sp. MPI-SDFR-AT-0127]
MYGRSAVCILSVNSSTAVNQLVPTFRIVATPFLARLCEGKLLCIPYPGFTGVEMSDLAHSQSPLLRLPRELREWIYTYAFTDFGLFPRDWNEVGDSDKNALFYELPGLCQANRQLFREATPIFLARDIYSWNTQTSQHLLNLYSLFPGDEATKNVEEFSVYDWTEKGTAIQLDLISRFTNLEFLDIIFGFPGMVDGEPMNRYDYPNEQGLWYDTGLHYFPPEGRSVEEEKTVLTNDLQVFINKYGLDRIIQMPKLKSLQFQFGVNDGSETEQGSGELYRHRLCNPLWRWATQKMIEKWGIGDIRDGRDHVYVMTALAEDYEHINMMGS